MRAVVQRVEDCSVRVRGTTVGAIQKGLLVYLGVEQDDTLEDCSYIAEKIVNLRIFEDEQGKMNLSLLDTGLQALIVSQFTLLGDVRKGRRPSFIKAAAPEKAEHYYRVCIDLFRRKGVDTAEGEFQAMMDVSYTNRGPVTILIDSKKLF